MSRDTSPSPQLPFPKRGATVPLGTEEAVWPGKGAQFLLVRLLLCVIKKANEKTSDKPTSLKEF